MARGHDNVQLINITPEQWAEFAAVAGFAVDPNTNKPLIGISGDEGEGYLVHLDPPNAIDGANLFRALAGHALRVGQAKVKASKEPSRSVAVEGANQALNGGYKPARERNSDIIEAEAVRQFEAHVAERVRSAKPDATEADIAATVADLQKKESGQKWIDAAKARVLETGTYAVSRKGRVSGASVSIDL